MLIYIICYCIYWRWLWYKYMYMYLSYMKMLLWCESLHPYISRCLKCISCCRQSVMPLLMPWSYISFELTNWNRSFNGARMIPCDNTHTHFSCSSHHWSLHPYPSVALFPPISRSIISIHQWLHNHCPSVASPSIRTHQWLQYPHPQVSQSPSISHFTLSIYQWLHTYHLWLHHSHLPVPSWSLSIIGFIAVHQWLYHPFHQRLHNPYPPFVSFPHPPVAQSPSTSHFAVPIHQWLYNPHA